MDPNRLTEKAQDAVRQAQSTAQRQGHSQIEAEHLAVGLLEQEGGVASRVLEKAGVSPTPCSTRWPTSAPRRRGAGWPGGSSAGRPSV